MFKKLHKKFLSIHLILITATLFLAFFAIFMLTFINLYHDAQRQMQRLIDAPTLSLTQILPPKTTTTPDITRDMTLSFKIFFNHNNQPLSYSSFFTLDKILLEQILESLRQQPKSGLITLGDKTWYYQSSPATFENASDETTTIAYSQISFFDITNSIIILHDLFLLLLTVGALMFFVILAISHYFSKQAIHPIKASFEKQQQFIADASHELKTPLAIISANTEVLFAHQSDTIANQAQWLRHIQAQNERMNKLIHDLLILAKNENQQVRTSTTIVDCSQLLNQTIAEFEVLSFERGFHLDSLITPHLCLLIDADNFQQLCFIFLDNALKYTTAKGTIHITFSETKHAFRLVFSNSFPTIPTTEVAKLFDRFYRADSARTHTGSYGLGLAIAQQLIANMNAKIKTQSCDNQLTFTIVFPKR